MSLRHLDAVTRSLLDRYGPGYARQAGIGVAARAGTSRQMTAGHGSSRARTGVDRQLWKELS